VSLLVTQACLNDLFCEILGDMVGGVLVFSNLIDCTNCGKKSQNAIYRPNQQEKHKLQSMDQHTRQLNVRARLLGDNTNSQMITRCGQ
jgi:hypothetical protein